MYYIVCSMNRGDGDDSKKFPFSIDAVISVEGCRFNDEVKEFFEKLISKLLSMGFRRIMIVIERGCFTREFVNIVSCLAQEFLSASLIVYEEPIDSVSKAPVVQVSLKGVKPRIVSGGDLINE